VEFKTADLYDEYFAEVDVCLPILHNFGGVTAFCGPVATVKCFEDNSRVKEATAEPGNGRVLVVDGGGSMRCALLGDLMAAAAVQNGWAGLIIDGCVRDTLQLAEMDIGIYALASTPKKSVRLNEGSRDGMVEIAGVKFNPNDWVFADEDGILVGSRNLLAPPA
jgi:regulator of ribonuclease activity A